MPINGVIGTISRDGIRVQGSLFGSSEPNIDKALADNSIDQEFRVFTKKVFILDTVSASGQMNFSMPVSIIENKAIIFHKGKAYFPNIDFTSIGNNTTWLNGSVSLKKNDDVIVWGAVNKYTADCMTFENIDMTDIDIFDSNVITLTAGDEDPTLFPVNSKSIYLFVANKVYSSEKAIPDFSFDNVLNEVTWLISGTVPITSLSKVFACYFNKTDVEGEKLGEILEHSQLTVSSDSQEEVTLSALPREGLLSSSHIFKDGLRFLNGRDYVIQFPLLRFLEGGKLAALLTGNKLDLSYFISAIGTSATIGMMNQIFLVDDSSPVGDVYSTDLVPFEASVDLTKVMVWFNGIYTTNSIYDNIDLDDTLPGTYHDLGWESEYVAGTPPKIKWYSVRDEQQSLIPDGTNDRMLFTAFTDAQSQSKINIEYFQRVAGEADTHIVLTGRIQSDKAILFYRGLAYFKQLGEFTIDDSLSTSRIPYASLPAEIDDPVTGTVDEITVWYITDEQYASLWKFDAVTNAGAAIVAGDPVGLPDGSVFIDTDKSMMFKGGMRYYNVTEYDRGVSNNAIKFLGSGNDLETGESFVLVHT